jgi:arsenical pump membrane protein
MALIAASTVAAAPATPATRQDLAAAVLLGVDLGPNLTIVGSLSTMLWLLLLRRRGLDVSGLEYLRVGALLLPPALLAAALTLWLVQQL